MVVAVIDTGITQHPDPDLSLADAGYDFTSNAFISGRASDGRLAGGWDTGDGTSEDKYLATNGGCAQPGQQTDSSWHGTHVAGTIAMLNKNNLGMVGIAGGTTVVVAAGNDSHDAGGFTPASCPGVINVAATGITGKRAFYSSYGNGVTLAAPGSGVYRNGAASGTTVRAGLIWSSLNRGTHAPGEPNYAGYSGTSMAAAHVAGVAALAISAAIASNQPVPTPARLREILTQTSIPFPIRPTLRIGAGILNANAAVARAAGVTSGGGEEQAVLLSRGATVSG
ncbi:S8 family serine peptidase [Xanthomonas populi]|uniref:S8 family serine peptidase n=1 Tax=Xanthomonas populi TaxID=53414 RepID=UPI001FCA21CE|nr:S8 family serine peptidase [Xanthomonas populi]